MEKMLQYCDEDPPDNVRMKTYPYFSLEDVKTKIIKLFGYEYEIKLKESHNCNIDRDVECQFWVIDLPFKFSYLFQSYYLGYYGINEHLEYIYDQLYRESYSINKKFKICETKKELHQYLEDKMHEEHINDNSNIYDGSDNNIIKELNEDINGMKHIITST